MAVISFRKLFEPTMLTTSAAEVFSLDITSSALLNNGRVRLTNVTASPATVTLYVVPSGGAAAIANAIAVAYSIGANDYAEINLPTMKNGDALHGLASAVDSINVQQAGGGISS